ncbi:MAG: glycosyl hydrolase, partial [Sphingobacteriales bacterium]
DLHIKNNDLIVGTQGRSIYILDDLSVVQQINNTIAGNSLHIFQPAPAYRMQGRGGFFGRGGQALRNAGMNPPNGVAISYYLKEVTDSTKLTVTVLDKNHSVIKTFATDSKENKIDINSGLNQFVWNMNYPDAERIPEGMIIWNGNVNGPKAIPGTYYARFKTGKDSAEISFTIIADPNYKVNQQEYEEQLSFLLTARDKFSETLKTLKGIKDLRSQMSDYTGRLGKDCPKEVKDQADAINKKITAVEEALHQTKAKSGQDVLNYPIRLNDKLSNVYDNAFSGNGAPSKQVKEVYADISAKIDAEINKFKAVLNTDLPQLNQTIREKQLPVIGLKKD